MTLHVLNGDTLRALTEVVRVLVSPLLHASAVAWRASVHESMRALFHADQAMTILPAMGELVVSHDLDSDVLSSVRTWFTGFTPEGRLNLKDPVVNDWNRRRRQLGLQVYTRDIIDKAISGRVLESPFVNEALLPNRMQYWQGVYASGRGNADALLWVSHRKRAPIPYGDAASDVLGLLVSPFQAGLSAIYRLDATRAAIDAAAVPMLVVDIDGRERHRTSALGQLLNRDPDASTVISAATQLAMRAASGLLRQSTLASSSVATSTITTRTDSYALRATLLPEGAFGVQPSIGVLVRAQARATLPSVAELNASTTLTAREAEVALQLASGATRKQMAAALGITPNTVRAHTEHVFQKLGVSTRAAVGPAIQRFRR
jgi:DNA-binding CsgD family transcriptional regulator